MNENRNQGGSLKPQAQQRHPEEWERDLNPQHMAGQNIGVPAVEPATAELTAFHLRKRGLDVGGLDDTELKQVPVLTEGSRLQQGATYVNLAERPPREIHATADMTAGRDDAYVPKDRVAYEVWNRLIGEPKPGQE